MSGLADLGPMLERIKDTDSQEILSLYFKVTDLQLDDGEVKDRVVVLTEREDLGEQDENLVLSFKDLDSEEFAQNIKRFKIKEMCFDGGVYIPRCVLDSRVNPRHLSFSFNPSIRREANSIGQDPSLCLFLDQYKQLESLDFYRCCLSNQFVRRILRSLVDSKNLRVLRLEGECICESGALELSRIIPTLSSLQVLLVSPKHYLTPQSKIGDTGAIAILEALYTAKKLLIELNLSDNGLTDASLPILGTFLQSNSRLQVLDLSGNHGFNGTSLNELIDPMGRHPCLGDLRICVTSSENMDALCEIVRINRSLESVRLDNMFHLPTTAYCLKLMEALRRNCTLSYFETHFAKDSLSDIQHALYSSGFSFRETSDQVLNARLFKTGLRVPLLQSAVALNEEAGSILRISRLLRLFKRTLPPEILEYIVAVVMNDSQLYSLPYSTNDKMEVYRVLAAPSSLGQVHTKDSGRVFNWKVLLRICHSLQLAVVD